MIPGVANAQDLNATLAHNSLSHAIRAAKTLVLKHHKRNMKLLLRIKSLQYFSEQHLRNFRVFWIA